MREYLVTFAFLLLSATSLLSLVKLADALRREGMDAGLLDYRKQNAIVKAVMLNAFDKPTSPKLRVLVNLTRITLVAALVSFVAVLLD